MGVDLRRRSLLGLGSAVLPVLGVPALFLTWGRDLGPVLATVVAVVLAGAVLTAVHHAEVVAHRVGEPFGSLVLAIAVTIVEVASVLVERVLPLGLRATGGSKLTTPCGNDCDHCSRHPIRT